MSYCLNPDCSKPQNPDDTKFCITCGTKLLLKERYRAIQPLGVGGCGQTFKAVDRDRLNHPCAIKLFLLPPEQDQKATELFNQEAVRLYELGKHDQIPELYAHLEQDSRLYLVQEFIDGLTLSNELENKGIHAGAPDKESVIREILTALLPVLQFIHDRGVIHRDIKPANIMRRHSDGKVVLIDFGVAKQATGAVLVGRGTMIGTLGYAPAEQLQSGEAYPASDLYALGATCIHLLTGVHPFNLHNPLEGCLMWHDHLPEGTSVSPQLAEILDKLVKNWVKDRYQSADEVLQDLNPALPLLEVGVLLESERDIDYTKLRDLLAARKWKEADEETRIKMLEVMGKHEEDYLDERDIETFPCKDFRTLDRLWVHYSSDRFGLSVQKRLWMEEGGKPGVYNLAVYEKFGEKVGWRDNDRWRLYSDLSFASDSPVGHLPLGLSIGWGAGAIECVGVEGAVEVDRLFSRVETCGL